MHSKQIIKTIKEYKKFKKDAELAKFLDIKPNVLSNWKARDVVDTDLIITKCDFLNPLWVIKGEGEVYAMGNAPTEDALQSKSSGREHSLPVMVSEENPTYNKKEKSNTEMDYKDRYIALLEKQLEQNENSENALKHSISLLMNELKSLSNIYKINSESTAQDIRALLLGQKHQMAFSQYVSQRILKQSLSEIEKESDRIKRGLLETLEHTGKEG